MTMSDRARRVATAAAAAALGLSVLATAGPAAAESRTLKDGRGDTWDISQPDNQPVKRSGNPEADLRKVTIQHTGRKVVVTAKTQNLRKAGEGLGLTMNIDTPSDVSYNATVYGEPGAWKGQSQLWGSDGGTCTTRERMSYRKDVVSITIPRSCLGRPDWVRLEIYGVYVKNENSYLYDNAHNGKADGDLTRRIRRG